MYTLNTVKSFNVVGTKLHGLTTALNTVKSFNVVGTKLHGLTTEDMFVNT